MLVPMRAKSPYVYRNQHTGMGTHTRMVKTFNRMSIIKYWAPYWYGWGVPLP